MVHDSINSFAGVDDLYISFFEALPSSSLLVKNDALKYTILAATPEYIGMIGIAKDNLIGKGMFEAFPSNPNDPSDTGSSDVKASFDMVIMHKKAHQLPVQRYDVANEDGTLVEKHWRASNSPVFSPNGEVAYIIHTAEDITGQVRAGVIKQEHNELLKAYKKIEESNQDFQFVTDFMPQMIWVTRPDGYHYYYNKKWYDYTGLNYGETEGEGWNDVFHPDDQQRARELWRHSLETGEPYEIEYRCRRYDGEYRWVLGRALALRDEVGTILKWFGTCTDIHDQVTENQVLEQKVQERTAELEVAIEELKRSNANLEEFAHAASHDLKEPVRKILYFANQLKEQPGKHSKEDQARALNRILSASERMGNLIDDLLLYSHVSQRPRETDKVDLNYKIERVLEDLELDIEEKDADIKVSTLPIVRGYKRQLQQLFQNLMTNAIKYSKPGIPPRIEIKAAQITENERTYHVISVEDNGIGFEPQYADKIFQMFTRLHGKAEYSGTGVGLSIVKKVVENHNGLIKVESQLGIGSRFSVYLPVD